MGDDYGDDAADYAQTDAANRAWEHEANDTPEHDDGVPYCDYCEQDGHTFATCPRRDDDDGTTDDVLLASDIAQVRAAGARRRETPAGPDDAERVLLADVGAYVIELLRGAPRCQCYPCRQLRARVTSLDLT